MKLQKEVLRILQLNFQYPCGRKVLESLDETIISGERVGLVGPNGAGKTTLFLILAGIIKPTAGEVLLFNKTVKQGEFRPELGMVFQNQDDQLFCPSVYDDIAFGPQNMGLSDEEVKKRVDDSLEIMGIKSLGNRPPHELSGGEKRLVSLAGVLAMEPRLVIYDEPTSNLDLRYRRKLINFLKDAKQEAMLIASHDLEFILETCNRVIVLDNGKIIKTGNPKEVLADKDLAANHGLEVPHSLVCCH
ncbi:MAG: energy-coupling factor ABC transporter ATP-binding protein [Bacillota bacterium]